MKSPTTIATPATFAPNGVNIATVAGVTFTHISVDENGRTGSETTVIFEGEYLPIKQQQSMVRNWGAYTLALTRIDSSTRYRLTGTFPFDEFGREPNTIRGTYELDIEADQPSVFSNPVLRSQLPDNYIALVARVCSDFDAGQPSMSTTDGGAPVTDGGWRYSINQIKKGIGDPLLSGPRNPVVFHGLRFQNRCVYRIPHRFPPHFDGGASQSSPSIP